MIENYAYLLVGMFFAALSMISLRALIEIPGQSRRDKKILAILALIFGGLVWLVAILQTQTWMPEVGIVTLALKAIPFAIYYSICGLIFVVPVSLCLGIGIVLLDQLLAAMIPGRVSILEEGKE